MNAVLALASKRRALKSIAAACAVAAHLAAGGVPAQAISIELDDAAPDRVDRQRKAAEGDLPLAGTPDLANLEARLASAGLAAGAPVFIRAFKAQSELELWMLKDGAYRLFATYPICYFSGTLGPKMREGDRQTPEGFYNLTRDLLHRGGRWPRSLDIGYPNVFDRAQARHGSAILVHGGCTSIGCFAMTNPVIKEIYDLTEAAILQGQANVPIHVFPFRMTDANLDQYRDSPWRDFWLNLKQGHDAFERTGMPPQVSVCENRYDVEAAAGGSGLAGPLNVCGAKIAAVELLDRWYKAAALRPSAWTSKGLDRLKTRRAGLASIKTRRAAAIVRDWSAAAKVAGKAARRAEAVSCAIARPSCRKFVALRRQMASKSANKRVRTASGGR